MSLLLDALKKAAERKAEISSETDAERESSDETVLLDETHTELADETRANTASESEATSQHAQSDSSVFDPADPDLSQYDETETRLEKEVGDDNTAVSNDPIVGNFYEDETLPLTKDDVTDFLGDDTLLRRELDGVTESQQNDTEIETAFTQTSIEQDESKNDTSYSQNEPVDEDPSISLFDVDDTLTVSEATQQTSALPEETNLDRTPLIDVTKSLNLVGVPDKDASEVKVGRSEITPESTSITLDEPHTLNLERISTRLESTSTQTYAPDNYDRTLRRPGSNDVSKIYAGLESDTDVVMTPEYAKTMFRSKTSAKRVHNFKIYSATALGILIVVAVLGVLEIEDETINIDNSLRHLKRDPMPGLIKNTKDETFTDVFAATPGSEVDATILQLVENAELMVDTKEVVAVELGVENESLVENKNVDEADSEMKPGVEVGKATVAKGATNSVNNISLPDVRGNEPAAGATIQITSKSKFSEKDRWLREAYAAYQQGDDQLALEKYNAVLDVDPTNRNALLARAAINIQNNRVAEAIRDYRKLLLTNPKDSLAMSSMIAVANYSPAQSETQLKLMLRDEPDSPYLNFALGNIFGTQNRWQEAQGRYFAALENNPNDPNYAYNLAVSLEHIAKPKVAIAYYERALSNFSKGLATFNREVVDARLEMLRKL